jgi:hypothetical protein
VRAASENYLFAYRRLYLFYRVLPSSLSPGLGDEFCCRVATLKDIDCLTAFEPYRHPEEFREWLQEGAWVFLALDGERPVAFHAVSPRAPRSRAFSSFELSAKQVWTVDIYTLPEYRRRHVATRLRGFRNLSLREWGFEEIVSHAREDNIPSLVYSSAGSDVRLVQRLTYLRLLWLRRTWLDEDARVILETHLADAKVTGRTLPGMKPSQLDVSD